MGLGDIGRRRVRFMSRGTGGPLAGLRWQADLYLAWGHTEFYRFSPLNRQQSRVTVRR